MERAEDIFLGAWLRLRTTMSNVSVSQGLTPNEFLVCYALYLEEQKHPGRLLTPTELAQRTKIRKSQVNRNLNQLEGRGIITRTRSDLDHRRVMVRLNMNQAHDFVKEHSSRTELAHRVIEHLGAKESMRFAQLMEELTELAQTNFPMDPE